MKKFEMPIVEVTVFAAEDVITTSQLQTQNPCSEDL